MERVSCGSGEQTTDMPDRDSPLADLLVATARGKVEAFAAFYDASSRRVFGLTRKILGDFGAAEEAALDAYAYAWRNASHYDPSRGDALQWMLMVARSKAIDLLRSRMRRRERECSLGTIEALADPSPGPETLSSSSERCCRVRVALAGLPREQREAIEIAYFAGLSHSEAATALGAPLGTVKKRIRNGRSSLRRQLAEVS